MMMEAMDGDSTLLPKAGTDPGAVGALAETVSSLIGNPELVAAASKIASGFLSGGADSPESGGGENVLENMIAALGNGGRDGNESAAGKIPGDMAENIGKIIGQLGASGGADLLSSVLPALARGNEGPAKKSGTGTGTGTGTGRSDRERLLLALKPYMSGRRAGAVDVMVSMMAIADALSQR